MTKKDKVTVDEVIGLIHTDKPTDSVEEVKKLRGRTNERFIIDTAGTLIDMMTRNTFDYVSDVVDLLNGYDTENEQLKQRNTNQYNQLTELWEIIEEENWEKLIAMKKQLKEDEERLRNEWKCYE